MAGAWSPFYRNHNTQGAISQEPFRWESVANASRVAINKRLEMLPTLYSILARSTQTGAPSIRWVFSFSLFYFISSNLMTPRSFYDLFCWTLTRSNSFSFFSLSSALWYEFPQHFDQLKGSDSQYLFGPNILVTPVMEPNVTTVKGFFPSQGAPWRNVYDHTTLNTTYDTNSTISAPLSTINVHARAGSALLTYQDGEYDFEKAMGREGKGRRTHERMSFLVDFECSKIIARLCLNSCQLYISFFSFDSQVHHQGNSWWSILNVHLSNRRWNCKWRHLRGWRCVIETYLKRIDHQGQQRNSLCFVHWRLHDQPDSWKCHYPRTQEQASQCSSLGPICFQLYLRRSSPKIQRHWFEWRS